MSFSNNKKRTQKKLRDKGYLPKVKPQDSRPLTERRDDEIRKIQKENELLKQNRDGTIKKIRRIITTICA